VQLLSFVQDVFKSRPLTAIGISITYFIAGILELFSMAMILPVLMGLFESSSQSGMATQFLSFIKLDDITPTQALVYIAVFMSLRGILMYLADLTVMKVAYAIERDTRNSLFSSFLEAKWSYIFHHKLGELPNIILRESERYSLAVQYLGRFLSGFFIAGVLVASSVFASWQLCALFVLAVLPYLLISRLLNKKISRHAESRVGVANDISHHVSESTLHLKYIKSSALEKKVTQLANQLIDKYAHHAFKVSSFHVAITHFPEVFGVITIAILITLAQNQIGTDPSDIIFFLLLMFRSYRQIASVQKLFGHMLENIPSYTLCKNMIKNAQAHKEELIAGDLDKSALTPIHINDLYFSYSDDSNAPTLSGINLDLPPNGIIVFTGESGAGKSTLIDLILGLIKPNQGSINLANNTSLNDINLLAWREAIGYVPQEPFLISGSIRDNILLHSDDKSDENLFKVAKMAKVDSFVSKLSDGYDTKIGLINTGVSGGQKQRIALARALAGNPSILILDEATSALDAQTAEEIRTAIKEIAKEKLVLMIAHNQETMDMADMLYILDKGQAKKS